jgi:hypothetical protein
VILKLLLLAIIAGVIIVWLYHKANRLMIRDWCNRNRFTLIALQRTMLGGPFGHTDKARNTDVFHVKVRDEAGAIKSGYIAVGGPLNGQVRVQWDNAEAMS